MRFGYLERVDNAVCHVDFKKGVRVVNTSGTFVAAPSGIV